ncbi:MAG: multidrug efflux MFS transporter, partial [Eubacterium sp.]|nr:multidrug efflux MFS transporter [Eubacterium sp.]
MFEKATVLPKKKRTLIFINLLISCIASSLLSTALTTALPPIMEEINVNVTIGQWLTSGYSLAMGIMMPLTAFLITRFKTRKLYIGSIALFISGLVICVISKSFAVMMIGRILQACGNGILTSMAQVVLLTIYPPEQRGTVMGWYGLSVGAAPVIAPTLAGIIVDTLGWRMIFYIAIAIMAVSFVFAIKVFDNVLETENKKFDLLSFVISALAFGGITLGIGNLTGKGITDIQTYVPLAVGCVSLVIFIIRQLRLSSPFLELRILKHKDYALSVIGSMLLYFVMMGSSLIMPLYVQSIMGESATVSGIVTLPGSLAMAVVSPFAGKIYDKVGMRKLFLVGTFAMIISTVGMFTIKMTTPLFVAAIYNLIRCIAIGCLMMPLVTWGIDSIESKNTAHGTALLTSIRTIAGAVGSAVFVGIMTIVQTISKDTYLENADIHGLNITFLAMSVV